MDWLREFSEREIEGFRRRSDAREYGRGATVFTPKTNPHSLFVLEQGLVRIYRLSHDGNETTFGYVAPGEVFGELTAFGDFPRESFAMAVQPSRVWKIPREVFQELLEKRPALIFEITRQIGQRMKRIESRVEHLVFRDVRSRVVSILLELAQDFGVAQDDKTLVAIDLTQSEFATLVGSTRQTVNASLRDLEEGGLIERNGRRIVLTKPQELARLVPRSDPR